MNLVILSSCFPQRIRQEVGLKSITWKENLPVFLLMQEGFFKDGVLFRALRHVRPVFLLRVDTSKMQIMAPCLFCGVLNLISVSHTEKRPVP